MAKALIGVTATFHVCSLTNNTLENRIKLSYYYSGLGLEFLDQESFLMKITSYVLPNGESPVPKASKDLRINCK
jgi:hypothetical protein